MTSSEWLRYESAERMLTAMVDACEGNVELNCCGICRAYTDEAMNLWLELQDGRRDVTLRSVDVRSLEEAIYQWRDSHSSLFQRILGAMM